MERKFCYICGGSLSNPINHSWWCKRCEQRYYDNPKPCADLFLFDASGRLLVARRAHEPRKGMLDIPGGFADFDETLEEVAQREIAEELGLRTIDYSKPLYVGSYLTDYPWGKENYQTLVAVFAARLKPTAQPTAMDDVAEFFFCKPEQLKKQEFGFPGQVDMAIIAAKAIAA